MKVALAGVVLAAATGVLVALYVNARARGVETHCRNNLRHLGGLAARNWNTIDPSRTGRDFWQAVREAQYRDVRGKWQPITPDPFICPARGSVSGQPEQKETIDYRGPAKVREQLRDMPKDEPIGADRADNHPSGGHVLRLDSSVDGAPRIVERLKKGDPGWTAAGSLLKD